MNGIMNNGLANGRLTELETQACSEAGCLFEEHLKLFPVSHEAVERLERNLLKLALAANSEASQPPENILQTDDGVCWHRNVQLMDNISLCHRPESGGVEYAVVEHFPARGTNEIWNRGWDAVQVLKIFALEQREALEFGTREMVSRTMEFLAQKFSGQDLSRIGSRFQHQFGVPTLAQHSLNREQNRLLEMVPGA